MNKDQEKKYTTILNQSAADLRYKQFMRRLVPIFVLVVIFDVIVLLMYFNFFKKKQCNFLVLNSNSDCVFYLNQQQTNAIILETPRFDASFKYDFDCDLIINKPGNFLVSFSLDCQTGDFEAKTNFDCVNGVYSKVVAGQEVVNLFWQIRSKGITSFEDYFIWLNVDVVKI